MVQATDTGLDIREVARRAATDPASADALAAVGDLLMAMQRSRVLTRQGAPTQALLVHLAKCGARRPADIAAAMHLDQSTVSRHVANLVSAGLVARAADPTDGRAALVQATDAGVCQAEAVIGARVRQVESVLSTWSDEDRAAFARLVSRFASEFESQVNEEESP